MSNVREFCSTCPHFERDPQNLKMGTCHGTTPQLIFTGQLMSVFPPVDPNLGWCDKHPDRKLPELVIDVP